MKELLYFFAVGVLTVAAVCVGCSKKSDPAPSSDTIRTVIAVVTPQTVANGTANVYGGVYTTDGTANLKLEVTSASNVDYIYILSSSDNSAFSGYFPSKSYTDSLKNTFTPGSAGVYSYSMPNTNNFVLTMAVPVRTTSGAVSDVYKIWFTNGKGGFNLPAKNTIIGPVTVTLNYTRVPLPPGISVASSLVLGDQTATPGSLLSTSGQISVLTTALYDSSANSADLALCALDVAGTVETNNSGYLWLTSPSLRTGFGYPNEPSNPNPNVSYIMAAPDTVNFDKATGIDLTALTISSSSTQEVLITNGGVYEFLTTSGKMGLIKVTSLTNTAGSPGTATVSVKVLN
jgi:hypothetical protein